MPRVSLFVHDLAANPIVRASPFALAFQRLGWEVEILGFRYHDQPIYAPFRDTFRFISMPTSGLVHEVLRDSQLLAKQAKGDVIYAFKPLLTTLLPALFAKRVRKGRVLLLDVEDDELVNKASGWRENVRRHVLGGWSHVDALKYRLLLHPFTRISAETTVVSRRLHARYGGTIILHGPDETVFAPAVFDPVACRQTFGLPANRPTALFAGVPHAHKGLRAVVEALGQDVNARYVLVYAGPHDHPEAQFAAERLGGRFLQLGLVDNRRMPELLAATDVVPIAQAPTRFAEAQIPGKLLEAMAMGRAIVATRVADIPSILGFGTREPRGWIVDPGDVGGLGGALHEAASRSDERQRRGAAAREFYLAEASVAAIARRLQEILARVDT